MQERVCLWLWASCLLHNTLDLNGFKQNGNSIVKRKQGISDTISHTSCIFSKTFWIWVKVWTHIQTSTIKWKLWFHFEKWRNLSTCLYKLMKFIYASKKNKMYWTCLFNVLTPPLRGSLSSTAKYSHVLVSKLKVFMRTSILQDINEPYCNISNRSICIWPPP